MSSSGGLDSLSLALNQISYLVGNLGKKNFKPSIQEINHIVSQFGAVAERHLLRCLFSHIDFSSDSKSNNKDFYQILHLQQEFPTLVNRLNFATLFSSATDRGPSSRFRGGQTGLGGLGNAGASASTSGGLAGNALYQVSRAIKLTRVQEIVLGVALLYGTAHENRTAAFSFLRLRLPEFLRSFSESERPDREIANELGLLGLDMPGQNVDLIRTLLSVVCGREFNFSPDLRDSFLRFLRREFTPDRVPLVLTPILYTEPQDLPMNKLFVDAHSLPRAISDVALADVMKELGPSCLASREETLKLLAAVGEREVNAEAVAHALCMMASVAAAATNASADLPLLVFGEESSLDASRMLPLSTWNVELFVDVLLDKTEVKWAEVVGQLDGSSLQWSSRDAGSNEVRAGFELLLRAVRRGLNRQRESFPIEAIYKKWRQPEAQLAFLSAALAQPDLFPFRELPGRAVSLDELHLTDAERSRLSDSSLFHWHSLDLIECLLRLSETGLYRQVLELFAPPCARCPELLFFSLIQASPGSFNTLKREVLFLLVHTLLVGSCSGGAAGCVAALQYAWHSASNSSVMRALLLYAMADWYVRTPDPLDLERLLRVFDVAQQLKPSALQPLLNSTTFAFSIDLACLAARRDMLKLDGWLTPKLREHGENFAVELVRFLNRRCPQLFEDISRVPQLKDMTVLLAVYSSRPPGKFLYPYLPETAPTMVSCLQSCAPNLSLREDVRNAIQRIFNNCQLICMMSKQQRAADQQFDATAAAAAAAAANTPKLPAVTSAFASEFSGGSSLFGGPLSNKFPSSGSLKNLAANSVQPFTPSGFANGPSSQGFFEQSPASLQSLTSNLLSAPSDVLGLGPMLAGGGKTTEAPGAIGVGGAFSQLGAGPLDARLGASDVAAAASKAAFGGGGTSSLFGGTDSGLVPDVSSTLSGPGGELGHARTRDSVLSLTSALGGMSSWVARTEALDPIGLPASLDSGKPMSASLASAASDSQASAIGPDPLAPALPASGTVSSGFGGSLSAGEATTSSSLGGGGGSARQQLGGGAPPEIIEKALLEFPPSFSKETEDEANSYFQRLYNMQSNGSAPGTQVLSVDDMLDLLRQFKNSNTQKQEVYLCMLRNLFEEYCFFPEYPDHALYTSAVVFGGLIECGLLMYATFLTKYSIHVEKIIS